MPPIRVLLADDHETVREGLKTILNAERDVQVVGEAGSGTAAVEQARALKPHIVIMDVSMPQMNGLQATTAIVASCPETRVLVLTRHAERPYLQQLLRAGASGYVLKQSRAAILVAAVRTVAGGATYLDPAMTTAVVGQFVGPSSTIPVRSGTMSAREEEVLRLVAWGYSNKEIAARLDVSVKTVETHKSNVMQKLGLRNRIDIVRFAVVRGWLRDG